MIFNAGSAYQLNCASARKRPKQVANGCFFTAFSISAYNGEILFFGLLVAMEKNIAEGLKLCTGVLEK
jgi:hypothetical protein